jgi:hypothetical protein
MVRFETCSTALALDSSYEASSSQSQQQLKFQLHKGRGTSGRLPFASLSLDGLGAAKVGDV